MSTQPHYSLLRLRLLTEAHPSSSSPPLLCHSSTNPGPENISPTQPLTFPSICNGKVIVVLVCLSLIPPEKDQKSSLN
ncbi:hypothetical protein IAS59_004561 [Cryptococcus gattii]